MLSRRDKLLGIKKFKKVLLIVYEEPEPPSFATRIVKLFAVCDSLDPALAVDQVEFTDSTFPQLFAVLTEICASVV